MIGMMLSTLFWNRVLDVPAQRASQVTAHQVWESPAFLKSQEERNKAFFRHLASPKKETIAPYGETEILPFPREKESGILPIPVQNVLVVAPHPDDEILCCAAHVREHLAKGDTVSVVFVTNGDGKDSQNAENSLNYGEQRKKESLRAARKLGIPERNLFFLGFPDSYLADIEKKKRSRSIFTHLVQTMRSSFLPGTPYTWDGLQRSLKKVLKKSMPTIVYMPGQEDQHPDHRVAARAIRIAMNSLSGIAPEWREYVVHSEAHVCVPQEVDTEKLALIREFRTQRHDRFHAEFLDQFASCEEQFCVSNVHDQVRPVSQAMK